MLILIIENKDPVATDGGVAFFYPVYSSTHNSKAQLTLGRRAAARSERLDDLPATPRGARFYKTAAARAVSSHK